MKVPEYREQVGIPTTQTQPTRMPQISMPAVVPGAFGEDVGKAIENLGKVGEAIAVHLHEMNVEKQDREVLRRETSYMTEWQNRLSDQEEETIDGRTRPKGYLLRQYEDAEGVTLEANQANPEIRKRNLEGLSQYQLNKLEPFLDKHFLTIQRRITTHEANQWDASTEKETKSNLDLKTQEASLIRDSKQLTVAIDDAIKTAAPYYRKYDEATRAVLNEDIAKRITSASAISTLNDSGEPALSQALLDSAKGRIAKSTYDDIKSTLAKGYKSMKAEAEHIRKEERIKTRFDLIAKTLSGEINWTNSDELIRQVARTDIRLAEGIKKTLGVEDDFEPEEKKNEKFLELAENMFSSSDPEEVSDFLVSALSDTKDISRDRLAILMYAARARSEELERGEGKGFLETVVNMIKSTPFYERVNILINTIKRMQTEKAEGEKIIGIAKDEIRKQRLKENPVIGTFPEKGQLMIDANGNKSIVYPDGREEIE